ncbi:unnamed protein product [Sphenostylis stenocarpa]|uniref:Uncharacterized protein n=1 Tax=Sphenostylis stenocarpa TaxID=92480 RepID=A0AA86VH38_9FABA|nr:unnamed protein product [Sphenostylis stenocarpa]
MLESAKIKIVQKEIVSRQPRHGKEFACLGVIIMRTEIVKSGKHNPKMAPPLSLMRDLFRNLRGTLFALLKDKIKVTQHLCLILNAFAV